MSIRRAGGRWRLLVHDYTGKLDGTGCTYGNSHNVSSDDTQPADEHHEGGPGILPFAVTHVTYPQAEFDELVVGRWLHIGQMDIGRWWVNVGGVTLWVRVDRDGRPKEVNVYAPDHYADAVPGCKYNTWDGEDT